MVSSHGALDTVSFILGVLFPSSMREPQRLDATHIHPFALYSLAEDIRIECYIDENLAELDSSPGFRVTLGLDKTPFGLT